MTNRQEHPTVAPSREADVVEVVRALQGAGPLSLPDLARVPGLDTWPDTRLEDAVIAAWSRLLISVDPRDRLVAL